MIIDSHLHSFPNLNGVSGWPSEREHFRRMQRDFFHPSNPPRYKKDNSLLQGQTLWNGRDIGPEGLLDVNFRIGRHGRIEWDVEGNEVYVQFLPPSLFELVSPSEYIIVEMDYAEVDIGVLQHGGLYGRLNDHFSNCIRKHPGRFIGLAQIEEARADSEDQLVEINRCARELDLKGLFYEVLGFWEDDYRDNLDDIKYRTFWEEVCRLGFVVFWDPAGGPYSTAENYSDQLVRIMRVFERHGKIPSVLVQALPISYFAPEGTFQLPDIVHELSQMEDFYFEIAYPISYGGKFEYPYFDLLPLIQQLYDLFGPEKLVWGSDMPNVLRYCTYRQSRQYLHHCDFLNDADLSLILGGNLSRLFRII